ncbi:sensor histidine kinase [Metabacillus herbersteinensis]|uniref:histidine kinase n=1 Tax=Metabacillus herbersteinensis TaxID=283816 RepID=A0ABV6GLE9_9BACI
MRLQNKIHLYTAVLFVILLIIMNVSVYYVFNKLILTSELDNVQAETVKIVDGVNKSLGAIPPEELLRAYVPIDGMIRFVTEDGEGLPQVTSPTEQGLTKTKIEFYSGERRENVTYMEKAYAFESIPIIWTDGSIVNLQITRSIQPAVDNLNILRIVLITVTVIAMIPVIISSRVLSNLITKPVRSMTDTMKDIRMNGRFKRLQLKGESKDELYQMGDTFNHMIDLLESNYEKQEQFVSNASHELKTPLTVIESYASLMKRRGLKEPDLFNESIDAIHSEAIRMKGLTEQLLLLARSREGWNIELTTIDLGDFVQQTVKSFQNAYHREILVTMQENIVIKTDGQKLKQLLFIFLDNARKYSEDELAIVIEKDREAVKVRIIDKGIGIPKQDLPKVFDRFYRVDTSRSRERGGTGLGLSLAKEIADAIGVHIHLDSLEGLGTTVTMSFSNDDTGFSPNSHI